MRRPRTRSSRTFVDVYTEGLKAEDLGRLFTRDTREAYRFFARHVDFKEADALPRHRRVLRRARLLFMAFTMKLSPARRMLYAGALVTAAVGLLKLWSRTGTPDGTQWLIIAFVLMNLLMLLEVADRLSLKNDLEVAREIQLAMLPPGRFLTAEVETVGLSRPANTVGGDLFDVIPLADGRLAIAVGDVAGKGSPAALLMALLLAMLRTLVQAMEEETWDLLTLVTRLNVQVTHQSPGNRFITLFLGLFNPRTGELEYVNAGHPPALLLRADGPPDRLATGGVALGLFDRSTFMAGRATIGRTDTLAIYSDGITEAENPKGEPFDEDGLCRVLQAGQADDLSAIVASTLRAVEAHTADNRFADDLTILLLRRV